MPIGAHKRDPISREWFFFADPNDKNEWTARRYTELALRYQITSMRYST